VFDDPVVTVGIEEVARHPPGFTVVEGLVGMNEEMAVVLESPDDSDIA